MSKIRANNWWKVAQVASPMQQSGGLASGNGAPQAVASNPANGLANLPQNPQAIAESGGAPSETEGLDPDDVKKLLNNIIASGNQVSPEDKQTLDGMLGKASTPDWNEKLNRLAEALMNNNDPKKQTRDPETGEPDKMPNELAADYLKVLENMPKQSTQSQQQQQVQPQQPQQVVPQAQQPQQQSSLAYASTRLSNVVSKEDGEHEKTKKSRGNPFRVLMGRVGKLLDHGVDKHDIVRQLGKEMSFFSPGTIAKAIDIVKSYNKKAHQKDQLDVQEERDMIHGQESIGSGDMPSVHGEELIRGGKPPKHHGFETIKHQRVQQQRMPIAPMSPGMPMFAEASRSNTRTAQEIPQPGKGTRGGENIYDYEPDWTKRSTSELYSWLHTLTSTSKNDFKRGDAFPTPVSAKGAAGRLAAIRKELNARGWSQTEQDEWIKKQGTEG